MWHSFTINFSLPSADIAVVEMSDAFRQPSLFYHLGVRESFSMANNIILYCDTNSESLQSLKVPLNEKMERGKKKRRSYLTLEIGSLFPWEIQKPLVVHKRIAKMF